MKKILTTFILVIFALGTIMSQNINIKGFGNIPVKKEGKNYLIQIGKFGEFAFQGSLEPKDLTAKIQVDQLSHMPGFRVLSKLGLTDIFLNISGNGLYLNAKADTKSSLKKVCDLLKITTPYINVSAAIAPKALDLKGSMEFSDGPVEFLNIGETGTVVKFSSANISTTLEPGTAELGFETNVLITPTKFDPELNCTYSFTYDLVTQTLTGAGSMMSDWINPLGTSNFVGPNSIKFSNAAVEMGINIATLAPVNIGFAVEEAKVFTLDFGVVVTIDPVGKEVAFIGKRTKMNVNDFTTFLREGFGLKVPNVLPDIYYIEQPRVLFSPNGGSVGEVDIEKGIALGGHVKIGDAMEGPIHFNFDMENEITLHMDLQYDFRKFVMNEVRKIKPLAPVANEILKTFQVRKLYVDLYANKDDKKFNGAAKCDFEVFGKAHHIEFEAALEPEVIVQKLVNEIKKLAAPQMLAATKVITDNVKKVAGPALSSSIHIAQQGFNKLGNFGKVVAEYRHHITHDNCFGSCVPKRVKKLTGPVLQSSNAAVDEFYSRLHDRMIQLNGITPEQTMDLRYQAVGNQWKRLMNNLDNKWKAVKDDQHYHGYDKDPGDVAKLGREYRRLVNLKYIEHLNYRRALWKRLLTHGDGKHQIQNRWKSNYYIHDNFTKVQCATIKQTWLTAQWEFEPVVGEDYFRIKNAKKGTYLHIEHGRVETSDISPGWSSAKWKIERIPGTQYVRLKNRWKNTYLNIEKGPLVCSNIGAGAHSSHWDLRPMLKNVDWRSAGDWGPVEVYEPVRIRNRWKKGYLNIEKGPINSAPVPVGWRSAKWKFEPARYPGYFKIKNLWKNTYLNVEHGKLEATNINDGWQSAMWDISPVPGTPYVKIRNKWKKDWYLHHQFNGVQAQTIKQNWHSAMWELDYNMKPEPITVYYDKNAGCGTIYQKGIELKKHCTWLKTWHSIVVLGTMNNSFSDYKVVFYEKNKGVGAIYKVDSYGNMHKLKQHNGWRKTWEKVTEENGMIKFETASGYYEIYKVDDKGNISLHSKGQPKSRKKPKPKPKEKTKQKKDLDMF